MPIAVSLLPEQPHSRIPGAVLPVEQPAPIGNILERNPRWASQRARQMGNRRVRGYDQVEMAHDRGGVDERVRSAVEVITQGFHRDAGGQVSQLTHAVMLLQTDQ